MNEMNTAEQNFTTKSRNTATLWLSAASGAMGGLLFGYDWVVIGGAKPFYEIYFHLGSLRLQGWAMSCALIGCLLGAIAAGPLSNRFGRKRLLVLAASIFILSSLGTGLAQVFPSFVAWRVLGGFAIGLASSVSPMYIAEISPPPLRGRLVSLNQMAVVVGILSAQAVNWIIARPVPPGADAFATFVSWNGQWAWRWMFMATAVPAGIFFAASLLVPESPRWLATKNRDQEALAILERLGGSSYARQVLEDFRAASALEPRVPFLHEIAGAGVRRALAIAIGLAVLSQWCGINVIFNYGEEIFTAAGYPISSVLFNIVITGAVNVTFTAVSLAAIDRFGRRVLVLTGTAGLVLIYAVLGTLYRFHLKGVPMLALVLAAIACYAMSLAPVSWVIIAEIFPNRIRDGAVSIAVTCLWIACFLLTYTFPMLNVAMSTAGVFWIYAGICMAGFLFLFFRLPETRNRSLEQIEIELLAGKL